MGLVYGRRVALALPFIFSGFGGAEAETIVDFVRTFETPAEMAQGITIHDATKVELELLYEFRNPNAAGSARLGSRVAIEGNTALVADASRNLYRYTLPSIHTDPVSRSLISSPTGDSGDAWAGRGLEMQNGTIFVSAWTHDGPSSEVQSGSVYTLNSSGTGFDFDGSGGAVNSAGRLTSLTAGEFDYRYFGGDMDVSDNRLLIGVVNHTTPTSPHPNLGGAVLFDIESNGTLTETRLYNPNTINNDNDNFGENMGVSDRFAVINSRNNDAGDREGEAYVYVGNGLAFEADGTYDASNIVNAGEDWGSILLSANNSHSRSLFDLDNDGQIDAYRIDNPSPGGGGTVNDRFGGDEMGIAVYGDYALIGSRYADEVASDDRGAVYLFDLATGAAVWSNPVFGDVDGDGLGTTLAMTEDLLIMGAWPGTVDSFSSSNTAGYLKIYDYSQNLLATIDNPFPDAAPSDNFGLQIDVDGDFLIVGTHQDDTGGTDEGAAYVYRLSSLITSGPGPEIPVPGLAGLLALGAATLNHRRKGFR